tara:strand:- start:1846 stop:2988 length:1143 start_codon:yes stop_codon:yes gene_type:complete
MKILLSSTQYPGNGGAATNLYKLNKYLLSKNIKVYCVFFLCNKEDTTKINIDPDKLGNVSFIRCFWKDGNLLDYNKKTNQYIKYSDDYISNFKNKIIDYLDGEPDVIYAKNYLAPITCKKLFPKSKIYYLVSGVFYTSMLNNIYDELTSAQKILNNFDYYKKKINECKNLTTFTNIEQEIYTLKMVDGVIYNSKLTNDLMNLYYKEHIKENKIINTSLLKPINNNCENFMSREYDLIFVCSNFGRKIKNSLFVKELLLDERLSDINKIIIGDGDLFNNLNIKNLTILKQQSNSIVLDYMKNSKLLILPSLFDSSPNTVYEALEYGCNVIISKNVGNYNIFNSDSVCEDIYDKDEWINKILNSINKKIINNIEFSDFYLDL